MDNLFSKPTLELPEVPPDFEKAAGITKTDFLRAVFALLGGTTIKGINIDEPTPYDLAALSATVESILSDFDRLDVEIRRAVLDGVNNGAVIVPFQDIGTNNYQVDVAFLTPNINFDPIQWSIVDGSKTTSQVTLRLDGRVGPFKIEVTIRELKD